MNGQLKATVTALEGEVARLHAGEKLQGSEKSPVQESSTSCNVADPLQADDPWGRVKVSNVGAWSKYHWKLKATIGDENGEKRGVQEEYVGGEKTKRIYMRSVRTLSSASRNSAMPFRSDGLL